MADNQQEKSVIDFVLELTNLEPVKLADILGVSKEYIYMLQKGQRKISNKLANKIEEAFKIPSSVLLGDYESIPELEIDLELVKKEVNKIPYNKPIKTKKGVPFYDVDVTATIAESYLDSKENPEYYVDFQPFNDCDAYTRIYGDSMYPKYQSGDIIAIKRLNNFDLMRWGETHLIITDGYYDNLRTIKNIHPCPKDDDYIIIKASNPKFEGDNKILKKHILGLFLVKGKASVHHM